MIVFEATFNGAEKKVFVANYAAEEERLFPVNLREAEYIKDDVVINIEMPTSIRKYTEACFVTECFRPGDQVTLGPNGEWKSKRSLWAYIVTQFNRLGRYCKDIAVRHEFKKLDKQLGYVERKVCQCFCYIDIDFGCDFD